MSFTSLSDPSSTPTTSWFSLSIALCATVAPWASVVVYASPWPTVQRMRRLQSTGQIPLAPYTSMTLAAFLWMVYGALRREPRLLLSNAVGFTLGCYYVAQYLRIYQRQQQQLEQTKEPETTKTRAVCHAPSMRSSSSSSSSSRKLSTSMASLLADEEEDEEACFRMESAYGVGASAGPSSSCTPRGKTSFSSSWASNINKQQQHQQLTAKLRYHIQTIRVVVLATLLFILVSYVVHSPGYFNNENDDKDDVDEPTTTNKDNNNLWHHQHFPATTPWLLLFLSSPPPRLLLSLIPRDPAVWIGWAGMATSLALYTSPLVSTLRTVWTTKSTQCIPWPLTWACLINCGAWSVTGYYVMHRNVHVYLPKLVGLGCALVQVFLKVVVGGAVADGTTTTTTSFIQSPPCRHRWYCGPETTTRADITNGDEEEDEEEEKKIMILATTAANTGQNDEESMMRNHDGSRLVVPRKNTRRTWLTATTTTSRHGHDNDDNRYRWY